VEGDALAALQADVSAVLAPTFARLGWTPGTGEDARTRQLRGVALDALGTLVADPAIIARAREVFASGDDDPDVSAASVAIVASAGDADTFSRFVARAHDATTPQEQLRYLYDDVRPQNGPFVLQRALRNRDHGPAAWAYVRDHWGDVRARFSGSLVPRLLDGVTWLVDDASLADVPAFLADHPVPEGARVIAQHLERQRVHRAVVDRERARLTTALLDR